MFLVLITAIGCGKKRSPVFKKLDQTVDSKAGIIDISVPEIIKPFIHAMQCQYLGSSRPEIFLKEIDENLLFRN